MTRRVFQLLLDQTGVGISGAPRRDEVANFVNLTNILGQPRVGRLGMRGAGTGWRGHANKTFTPTSLLLIIVGRWDIVCYPHFVFATRIP